VLHQLADEAARAARILLGIERIDHAVLERGRGHQLHHAHRAGGANAVRAKAGLRARDRERQRDRHALRARSLGDDRPRVVVVPVPSVAERVQPEQRHRVGLLGQPEYREQEGVAPAHVAHDRVERHDVQRGDENARAHLRNGPRPLRQHGEARYPEPTPRALATSPPTTHPARRLRGYQQLRQATCMVAGAGEQRWKTNGPAS